MGWQLVKFYHNRKEVDRLTISDAEMKSPQGKNFLTKIKESIKREKVKESKGQGEHNVDYTSSPLPDNPTGEDFFE